jgi:hypothetical protein
VAEEVLRYRKTRNGEWAVFGPVSLMGEGKTVVVTKADGSTKQETIGSMSRPFDVDGVPHAYGYIVRQARQEQHDLQEGRECDQCGRSGARYRRFDSSGIAGVVCGKCNREPDYCLSFA